MTMTTTRLNMNPTFLCRFLRLILPAIIILAASVSATADVRDLPVKEINGRRYYYYQVKPKDTFFSLTRALGVSRSEIEKYN
ncbi:MAG: LysM peptidoglycan-binding domain-containing protein, partial [Muribaculaceae bacterium]|nr:LysM peptidoglycan-binding domain-containing protein [Muribaculaceae bacterium]